MPLLKSLVIGASGTATISNLTAGQPVTGVASADFTIAYGTPSGGFTTGFAVQSPVFSFIPAADICLVTAAPGTEIEFRTAADADPGGMNGGLVEVIAETAEQIPNSAQAHASLATTGTASTLATLGYTAHANTKKLLIQAVGGDVRFTLNGTAPTASTGLKLVDGQPIEIGITEFTAAKFITGSGSPKLEIAAYILS